MTSRASPSPRSRPCARRSTRADRACPSAASRRFDVPLPGAVTTLLRVVSSPTSPFAVVARRPAGGGERRVRAQIPSHLARRGDRRRPRRGRCRAASGARQPCGGCIALAAVVVVGAFLVAAPRDRASPAHAAETTAAVAEGAAAGSVAATGGRSRAPGTLQASPPAAVAMASGNVGHGTIRLRSATPEPEPDARSRRRAGTRGPRAATAVAAAGPRRHDARPRHDPPPLRDPRARARARRGSRRRAGTRGPRTAAAVAAAGPRRRDARPRHDPPPHRDPRARARARRGSRRRAGPRGPRTATAVATARPRRHDARPRHDPPPQRDPRGRARGRPGHRRRAFRTGRAHPGRRRGACHGHRRRACRTCRGSHAKRRPACRGPDVGRPRDDPAQELR